MVSPVGVLVAPKQDTAVQFTRAWRQAHYPKNILSPLGGGKQRKKSHFSQSGSTAELRIKFMSAEASFRIYSSGHHCMSR